MYSMLNDKTFEGVILEIIKEAVVLEKEFITESLPCNLIGMNMDRINNISNMFQIDYF